MGMMDSTLKVLVSFFESFGWLPHPGNGTLHCLLFNAARIVQLILCTPPSIFVVWLFYVFNTGGIPLFILVQRFHPLAETSQILHSWPHHFPTLLTPAQLRCFLNNPPILPLFTSRLACRFSHSALCSLRFWGWLIDCVRLDYVLLMGKDADSPILIFFDRVAFRLLVLVQHSPTSFYFTISLRNRKVIIVKASSIVYSH